MTGFKFGFAIDGAPPEHAQEEAASSPPVKLEPAVEVSIPADTPALGVLQDVQLRADVALKLRCLTSESATRLIGNSDLASSDLLPGRYEGGLKLWESAVDLAQFLLDRFAPHTGVDGGLRRHLLGKRVIELGCGHGLPGIVCGLAGAEVCFQDYNAEALSMLAAPNLRLNASLWQTDIASARFFGGDWTLLGPLLSSLGLAYSFDMVVSAETIYSSASMRALFACIKQCLKPGGTAYIAAKTMYFGLDGGTLPFRQLVEQEAGISVQQVAVVPEGVAREVLELQLD